MAPGRRLREQARSRSTFYTSSLKIFGPAECMSWRWKPERRDAGEGKIISTWENSDGVGGYTFYQYSIFDDELRLLGPQSRVTRRPRSGGGGDSSFGCGRQMKIVAADADQIDLDGVRFYRSAERCQAELAQLAFLHPSGCR